MYNVNPTNIFKNIYKKCYISSKLPSTFDNDNNEIPVYDIPKLYMLNTMSITSDSEIKAFGEVSLNMKKATIPNDISKYKNNKSELIFKEFDKAYLDGASPTGETINGENSNYIIKAIQIQNTIIQIYFEKEIK
ncbi:MAG: hypothetical protein RR478_00865 [Bacilli bacterium]